MMSFLRNTEKHVYSILDVYPQKKKKNWSYDKNPETSR